MITSLITSLLIIFVFKLSMDIVKERRGKNIPYGTNDDKVLGAKIAAHSNMMQYSPLFLFSLFLVEHSNGLTLYVFITGFLFLIGRIIHARAMIKFTLQGRAIGMYLTFWPLLLNAIYLIYLYVISL